MHLVQCGPTTGGTVSHVATQVTHQIRRGLRVGVVAASEGVLTERCREAGADVFVDPTLLPTGADPAEANDPQALHERGSQWRPDLIHAHLMHAGFRGHELASALEVPLLYTQHMYDPIDPFLRAASAANAQFPVITVVKFAEETIGKFFGDAARVRHVPNGVDIPEPSGFELNSSSSPNLLYCGRLSPEKGADTAVLAFELILRSTPDAQLHIIGTGPDESLLRRMVSALGLAGSVHFYGSVSGALTTQLGADVLLVPSRADAANLVVLEAMASNIPIVATNVGGIPELIRKDIDGLIVAPDDRQDLAEATLGILTRPDHTARLRTSAHDRYRTLYTADLMVQRTCAVYEDTLREPRR
ncbi:glycosyltransferase family 4 protein [Actinoallomurus sp. NPDC050550]|uniref:glycosyltransferase family 4 protein n=1 Tax=Actinoallomurus sp. NPDC050550 TaxID=3154937 RepID=UPI0033F80F71